MTCMWAIRCQIIKREALAFHLWFRVVSNPKYEKEKVKVSNGSSSSVGPELKRANLREYSSAYTE